MNLRGVIRLASHPLRARAARRRPARAAAQRGYALLMVVFIAALMIIMVAAATPNLLTQGKRVKEDEMIWRGEQYKRAVGLYYKKNGRFPTSIDDLVKGTPGRRYLRQAYKDPMNGSDGTWRLIYVNAGGQLVGSIRFTSLAQMAAALRPGAAQTQGAAGTQPGGSDSGAQGQQGSNPPDAQSDPSASPQNPTASPGGPQPAPPAGVGAGVVLSGEQPQALSTSGGTFGGNIVGVASTVDKPSLKVYEGGTKYKQWEFIWNPVTVVTIGQTGVIPGKPAQGGIVAPSPFQNPTPNPPAQQPPNPQSPQDPQNP